MNYKSAVPELPTDNFTSDAWSDHARFLRKFEGPVRKYCQGAGLTCTGSSRWPELRIEKKGFRGTRSLSIQLDETELNHPSAVWRIIIRFVPTWYFSLFSTSWWKEIYRINGNDQTDFETEIKSFIRTISENLNSGK